MKQGRSSVEQQKAKRNPHHRLSGGTIPTAGDGIIGRGGTVPTAPDREERPTWRVQPRLRCVAPKSQPDRSRRRKTAYALADYSAALGADLTRSGNVPWPVLSSSGAPQEPRARPQEPRRKGRYQKLRMAFPGPDFEAIFGPAFRGFSTRQPFPWAACAAF